MVGTTHAEIGDSFVTCEGTRYPVYAVGDYLVHHAPEGLYVWDAGDPEGRPFMVVPGIISVQFTQTFPNSGRFIRIKDSGWFSELVAWVSMLQRDEYRAGVEKGREQGYEACQQALRGVLGITSVLFEVQQENDRENDRLSQRIDRLEIDKGWER